jgi:hypothetical protein
VKVIRIAVAAGTLLAAAALPACTTRSSPQIRLNTGSEPRGVVEVSGLPASSLEALSKATLSENDWQALLRVSVRVPDRSAQRPVAGTYKVADGVIRFTPLFSFDLGRQYDVVLDTARLPSAGPATREGASTLTAVVGLPAVVRTPSTVVTHLYPSAEALPANQLRMYIHFSAPMGLRSGFENLVLLDENGQEVVDAFLPLDADFFNEDRTRYTVFFDPGRVKRGILPNREMGRALEVGKRYTLVVRPEWRDGQGLPLKTEFRHAFSVAPAVERALTTSEWKVSAPVAGARDALEVTFPAPLDDGLLRRALGVARAGTPLEGEISIEAAETRWRFVPREPWADGDYQLVALSFLEDLAGNRIGRAFEVDRFDRTDTRAEPERITVPFRVSKGSAENTR